MWGEKVVFGAAQGLQWSGSTQGAAADSLGEDASQCLNNHNHHHREGQCSTDKDKDSHVNETSSH